MRRPVGKGILERMADDWPLVPQGLRQWLRKACNGFVDVHQRWAVVLIETLGLARAEATVVHRSLCRRAAKFEAKFNQTREGVTKGIQTHGFLVQYYMYNHDGNAMGGERHLRLPKISLLLKPSVNQVVSECCRTGMRVLHVRTRRPDHGLLD